MPAPKATGPAHISRLVYAIDPPPSSGACCDVLCVGTCTFQYLPSLLCVVLVGASSIQLHAAVYVNGVRQLSNKFPHNRASTVSTGHPPPSDLQLRHLWPNSHPSFQTTSCTNVKSLPNPAKGDGTTDDYEVIQGALDSSSCVYLPRGLYVTSRTLQASCLCAWCALPLPSRCF